MIEVNLSIHEPIEDITVPQPHKVDLYPKSWFKKAKQRLRGAKLDTSSVDRDPRISVLKWSTEQYKQAKKDANFVPSPSLRGSTETVLISFGDLPDKKAPMKDKRVA